MNFENKTAFVTGGGSGIGEAAAVALAARGAHVVVADLNLENATKVANSILKQGGNAIAVSIDVSDANSVDFAFNTAEEWYGDTTHLLVNSAGILGIHAFIDYPVELFNKVMAVNVTGTFLCSQRAGKSMLKAGYGRIVNVASVSAVRAGIGRTAYGTSKAAMVGLTKQLSMELGPHGVTANAIAPGPVLTPLTEASYTPETIEAYTSMIPARRLGVLDDMSATILFLLSEGAAYINGAYLPVDGGYLASGVSKTGKLS
ncbi:SDR family NAD(P)-dependent oxidoreductase [Pseudomonas sp. RIT288]|jgi:NAD(P)-dependent dehydrogenase (short-subunit alcohol dehydrogenase family)|uniref:SDR family NAD(P)-dependent oxidoreductase n=1 Tax=Pseudomonas sp. RIT288 TaxID=1470589 RepID=UPI000445051F|nr:SDR family NAD(P)-dependent oxidoreductase [Pseudomonas sp. RIT288]EZP26622.1 short-chain dehydrogenase/reductase SDR [Pseudomonas sp. RIT288]